VKQLLLALSALFLAGCSVGSSGFFEEKVRVLTPQEKTQPLVAPRDATQETPKETHKETPAILGTGYIKGVVRKAVYDAKTGLWQYEVEGTDTANAKLPFAKFTHTSPMASLNDRVYVRIENNRLKELYTLDKPSTVAAPRRPVAPSGSPAKRTLDRQVVSVPQSETIVFD